ncbi:hypothetical protein F4811DRAFT_513874 [Daldinia bambusicola]|nr:hypothetical protein F4811DRAFT_513874 [Daldinia bambusicola]
MNHGASLESLRLLDQSTGPETYLASKEPKSHNHNLGTLDHDPVLGPAINSCIECNASFDTLSLLNNHAMKTQHYSFACLCGERFSRYDAQGRHIKSFRKDSRSYPCNLCKRHRGRKAFHRRDHLVQHLRGYHQLDTKEITNHCPKVNPRQQSDAYSPVLVCPFVGCEHYRDKEFRNLDEFEQQEQCPFKSKSHYSNHLKDAHGEVPFPCHVLECDRVGSKGYLREKALKRHLAAQHPDAPEYSPASRKKYQYNCAHCRQSFEALWRLGYHQCNPPTEL